jgi:hypothetical protein
VNESEIKADIEHTRAELAATVDELSARLNRKAEEGKQLAIKVGGALAGALLLLIVVRRIRS